MEKIFQCRGFVFASGKSKTNLYYDRTDRVQVNQILWSSDTGLAVNRIGNSGSNCLTDPECMPHTGRTNQAAQKKCQWQNQDRIAAEGDHQRRYAFSKTFECSTGSDGYGRYDKSETDDSKCCTSGCDRLWVGSKESEQSARNKHAEQGACKHDSGRKI